MKTELTYLGYTGTVNFNHDDCVYWGEVNCQHLIKYEGMNLIDLEADFRSELTSYIDQCKRHGLPIAPPD